MGSQPMRTNCCTYEFNPRSRLLLGFKRNMLLILASWQHRIRENCVVCYMEKDRMKVSIICHGNVARSQILHHYLAEYANRASLSIDLFSCGTAPIDAFPDIDRMLVRGKEIFATLHKCGAILGTRLE